MLIRLSLLLLTFHTSLVSAYKVGLLLNSDRLEESFAISRLAAFSLTQLNQTNTTIHLKEQYHDTSHLSVMNGVCALFKKDVVAIISAAGSTLTKIQVNLAGQFNVPLISTIATNPFLESTSKHRTDLVQLLPSDLYQSQAIFDLLKEYKWHQFSILASADDYGINGVVRLQYLASQDGNFKITDIQHFEGAMDIPNTSEKLFSKELTLIKNSLTKVIVLNCGERYVEKIFRFA